MEQESQGEESGQVDSKDVVDLPPNVDKPRVVVVEPGEVDSLTADISKKALSVTMLSERTGADEKDVQSDEEDTDQLAGPASALTNAEAQELCKQLEGACMNHWNGEPEPILELLRLSRVFRGQLRRAALQGPAGPM
ncbi:hypothetical protein AZE42_10923 [Rhizopogon vesiculosus]|uniref:Uncharacterized protein n=1 Tax=Rhizopogon vesiculosus TaxID=180088 RepID=A0A1J8Q139_9AGAM|nr:hypothetical protein AZE42_10923 [Rhizopogon vesiculosus]